ncbi:sigma-54-dependent Fis family transcriptional regulator [Alteribacillus iranensis]|uniref:PAS domain S-box-containing protein n=1 Tax=Alteribacillus iranensis TaxID=930128 RepID=A0A1I2B7Q9_9BACI|nr:sigma-54-dependent Fis family transcriptional regulator [Alteribacillus iranensis]SFE51948.1 PAS domain S-box-containing protein [Alteribacillus iranensis]
MVSLDNQIVREWVNKKVVTLRTHQTIQEAVQLISRQKSSHIVIVDKDNYVEGVISFADLIESILQGVDRKQPLGSIANHDFSFCYEDDPLSRLTFRKEIITLALDHNGRLLGKIDASDIARHGFEMMQQIQTLEQMMEWYKSSFETAYEGVTVVDQHGIIRLFNDSYARYVAMSREEAIGKHCTEVIENTRLPVVLETGIPERNQPHTLRGVPVIAHRLPIWRGDEIIGAVGMLIFEGVSELFRTYEKVQRFREKNENDRVALGIPKSSKDDVITIDKIIGSSPEISHAKKQALRMAKTTGTVLITGESGVGKELFVKAIHRSSPVKDGPLISVNCAAIPEELIESELFGYEAGAFTGARQGGKPGKFELAHEGTLFLDEIGDVSIHLQAKLLRVLQEQTFERVGGTKEQKVNARIIAATNQPLEQLIEEGKFREDLYYRLNILPLNIPPLRERKIDIPILVSHLIERACEKHGLERVEMDQQAVIAFMRYHWPGNIRELTNLLERLVILSEKQRITWEDLPPYIRACYESPPAEERESEPNVQSEEEEQGLIKKYQLEDMERERELIVTTLQQVNGNKTAAAKHLGIHRSTLYKKMRKLAVE